MTTNVQLFDHGMNLPIYTWTLPPGWQLRQFVATDLSDPWRMYKWFVVDFFGPRGEVASHLFPTVVYPVPGQDSERVWHRMIGERLAGLGPVNIGPVRQSARAASLYPESTRAGIPVFERDVSVSGGNRQWQGVSFTLAADLGYAVLMYPQVVLAPVGLLDATLDALARIQSTQQSNPAWTARAQQLTQQRMQQAQAFMRQRQDWFSAYQSAMQQASQLRSQNNQAFSNYLKSTVPSPDGNGYTTTEQFTDYLLETTTFRDPYSGYTVKQPGQYSHWYTDSLGNYYGTDDPNFDPNALIGNWSAIAPLEPQ